MKQIGKTSNNFSQIKIKKIFNQKKSYWRKIMNALKNKDFTIISHNCVGGVIYHDLGLKFNTPTINLFFMAKDFIKFCNNLIHYLNCEMEPFNHEKYDYPIGQIDDVLLYGLHYNSFEELKEKWDERKKRVNHDNLFIMMSERDGCTLEDIENFDRLPYENKVIFVHKPMPNIKSAHYIPNTETIENGENCVVPLSEFKEGENKRYIDDFDYISFLNKGTI